MANEHTPEDSTPEEIKRQIDNLPEVSTPLTPKEKRLEEVKSDMRSGKVFFYICAGFDFRPILNPAIRNRFSTFVYCDWGMSKQDFAQENFAPWQGEAIQNDALEFDWDNAQDINTHQLGGVEVDMRNFTTEEEFLTYNHRHETIANREPWGCLTDISVDNQNVRLVYLCAEGVKTYLELFSDLLKIEAHAPEVLYMIHPGFDGSNFDRYEGILGRAVDRSISRPTWINPRGNWPWPNPVDMGGGLTGFSR